MEEDILQRVIQEIKTYGDLDEIEDIRPLGKALENLIARNKKLTSLIYKLRNELRRLLISYDGEYYRPIKNTTKQEIYESYFKVRSMLKGEYFFKDNETALEELLQEGDDK